jgi:uncharacterized membrane protein YqgA involved in biofilm formation
MIGTIINVVAVIVGGTLGTLFGARLPERLNQSVVNGLGLFTLAFGIQMFLKTQNSLVVIGSLLVGAIIGEWLQIEDNLRNLGVWLEKRIGSSGQQVGSSSRFVRGFLAASLLFCVGPMAILGSIQDGLTGNYEILAVKSLLDAFASVAFASSLGMGVTFSAVIVLIYQGAITLLANQVQAMVTPAMMTEMSAVGGLILMGLSIGSLLEIKPSIRAGNYLPALIIAPLVVWGLSVLGIKL